MGETTKWRHVVWDYCQGSGIDIGCGPDPVTPWAIRLDLPPAEYYRYSGRTDSEIHLRGDGRVLPWFRDNCLGFLFASHLLEDFSLEDWPAILREWSRVLSYGGYLVLLVPDHERFRKAVAEGQGDNLAHRHEPCVGETSRVIQEHVPQIEVIEDRLLDDTDYNILFVGRKRA